MALPKFLQTYFPGYDLSVLDIKRDKKMIITNVLNRGDSEAVIWLSKNYTISEIKKVVRNPSRGTWLRSNLLYWEKILDLDIPKETFELAIIDFNPRPKLYEKFFREHDALSQSFK